MVKENTQITGWRSFKFNYGSMTVQVETYRDSQLEKDLLNHIDELCCGGWRETLPTLDETEGN